MDQHIKAYHLNHWLLSLYAYKYLQCSVTLLSQGGTNLLVFPQTSMYKLQDCDLRKCLPVPQATQANRSQAGRQEGTHRRHSTEKTVCVVQ